MANPPLRVVWAYRRTGKFAFHVLSGALAADPELAAVPIDFADGPRAVVACARQALAAGQRVLVGWSFYSPDFPQLARELQRVRAELDDPRVLHVVGGVHATAEPLATLRAGFDVVAAGEGEHLVRELVRTLRHGGEVRGLPGVHWLEGDVLRGSGRGRRIELDDFPPFAPSLSRHGPIEITRGCIYACHFCQTPFFAGAKFRHRSVANVVEWARFLAGIGFRDLRFLTPTALSYGAQGTEPDLAAVEALLASVRAVIGPERRLWFGTFPSEVRPEHVTPQSLQLLKRYVDNKTLIIGGQSGSDAVLQASERGHDAAVVERATLLALAAGFVPHVDFLFGLPGEDEAAVAATLALMERLVAAGARVHGHTFLPLPGTPLRGAPPGRLRPEFRRRLLLMASHGQLYGQWEQQEVTARDLADGREVAG